MGLNYDKDHQKRGKSENERILFAAGIFPACTGLFPDCPTIPSLRERACRCCPKTDGLKKPKLNEGVFNGND